MSTLPRSLAPTGTTCSPRSTSIATLSAPARQPARSRHASPIGEPRSLPPRSCIPNCPTCRKPDDLARIVGSARVDDHGAVGRRRPVTAPPAAKSPQPSPSPSPRVASAAASEAKSPRSVAAADNAAEEQQLLSVSAPALHSLAPASRRKTLKQCTRCGTGKVAARVKLENGRTLALCRALHAQVQGDGDAAAGDAGVCAAVRLGLQGARRVAGGAREADGDAARRQRGQRRRGAAQAQDSEPGRAAVVARARRRPACAPRRSS
jgi:hypothetical protein